MHEHHDAPERDPLRRILEDINDCSRVLREGASASLGGRGRETKVMDAGLWKVVARRERRERGEEESA